MDIFPLGTLSGGSASGTITSVSYTFFEPNVRAYSRPVFTSLVTRFQNQTILSRKKADPYLLINYEYKDIFLREYKQIEHFIDYKEDAVNSFYVIDLSKGETPTAINTSSTWTASIPNTRLYSLVQNQKANYVFFYNSIDWKIGTITGLTANTSIVCNVDTNNFGTLSDTDGAVVTGIRATMIYPVYECYVIPNSLNSFKTTNYWASTDSNRGHMYSGTISFCTKYKV